MDPRGLHRLQIQQILTASGRLSRASVGGVYSPRTETDQTAAFYFAPMVMAPVGNIPKFFAQDLELL